MDCLISITDGWGTNFGGINSFNYDFMKALAKVDSNLSIFCIEIKDKADKIVLNEIEGVNVVTVDKKNSCYDIVKFILGDEYNNYENVLFIGHDIISGREAIEYSKIAKAFKVNSNSAVIHHMDYEAYYTIKAMDGSKTQEKIKEQEDILKSCDYVYAVGPKLKKSAERKISAVKKTVVELVPGIANINPNIEIPSKPFIAMAFGRIEKSTEIIKQSRLAVAALSKAIGDNIQYFGHDSGLTLYGLEENEIRAEQKELNELSYRYAKRYLPINGYPYTKSRKDLFDKLKNVHLCMMLSLHEGFGLVGWEAISAGVPSIISKNSGLYEFINAKLGGKGTGCIYSIDIKGKPDGDNKEFFTEEDLNSVIYAIKSINSDVKQAKRNALDLRQLLQDYTWERTANDFLNACYDEIRIKDGEKNKFDKEDNDTINIKHSISQSTNSNDIRENELCITSNSVLNDKETISDANKQIEKNKIKGKAIKEVIKASFNRQKLSFLVVGDSQTGKSSFIRTFCNEEMAKLLKITGPGQTTRFNCTYKFKSNLEDNGHVDVNLYTEEEFVEKQLSKIIEKYKLSFAQNDVSNTINPIEGLSNENTSDSEDEKGKEWLEKNFSIIKNLVGEDLIKDEFIVLKEFDIDNKLGVILNEDDISNITSFSTFLAFFKRKLEGIYIEIMKKTKEFIFNYSKNNPEFSIIGTNSEYENSEKLLANNFKSFDFTLTENTSSLLIYCIKQANKRVISKLDCGKIVSISGIVRNISINLELNDGYAQISNSVGINEIELVDTYGLDHTTDGEGGIAPSFIEKRLASILNTELPKIESVIFIAPMIGKSAGTNNRFEALIKAKRSIIPHIVYTKYDVYAEEKFDCKLFEIESEELKELVDEFKEYNINEIKGGFGKILETYYSKDVAEYRKKTILENISYFMCTYQIEAESSRCIAQKNNMRHFFKIVSSVLQNDNLGLNISHFQGFNFNQSLINNFLKHDSAIKSKLVKMLELAQINLNESFKEAHPSTKRAFWNRIYSNMFGYLDELNIRNILKKSYSNHIAMDSGEYKEDNLGNYIIDSDMVERKLNLFVRECINKFSEYYFCAGCLPCKSLERDKNSKMTNACNNTGIYQRKRRETSCNQLGYGSYVGSRVFSRHCYNSGIYGIGLFDGNYGCDYECNSTCYWNKLFYYFGENSKVSLLQYDNITDDFMKIFIEFCNQHLEKSKDAMKKLDRINEFYKEYLNI